MRKKEKGRERERERERRREGYMSRNKAIKETARSSRAFDELNIRRAHRERRDGWKGSTNWSD